MDEFLKVEYEQCLDLIKYYDERHLSLLKFAAGIASAVVSIIFGFQELGEGTAVFEWRFVALVSGVSALSLLAIYAAMTENRLYFVYPARQVNAIRGTMMSQIQESFKDNQMYTSTSVRAFRWRSSHTLMNIFVTLLIGTFVGLFLFSLLVNHASGIPLIVGPVALGLVTAVLVFGISGFYLSMMSPRRADASIFGRPAR